ncbi:MAG TPA: hypothetical protein VNM87_00120, partial [Candidatus Udaeobacter sp.]|nr:hypothetical protein [Candidatus Udaeobacter sp.]
AFLEAPSAAVDTSGVLHVVWVDARAGNRALWVRSQPPGGAFGAELRLTDPAADAGDPALIATADGALHLTWQDARISATNREIFYRRRASGIPWDVSGLADVRLSTASGLSDRPSIVADESSPPNLAVLWRDRRSGVSEVVLREFRPGGPIGIAELSAPGIPGPWLVLGPNPGSGVQAFRAPATESIEIRNAAGRLVQLLAAGTRGWNGVDAEGHPVAAGVYFLRGTATSRTERVVRLR